MHIYSQIYVHIYTYAALLSRFCRIQLCDQPTRLRRPWDSPGRALEWVAISFSDA